MASWIANYSDVQPIGKGTFSDVSRGRLATGDRKGDWVALKTVNLVRIENEAVRKQIRNEAERMLAFDHWCIVKLYSYFDDTKNGLFFLEMEYCPDGNLAKAIAAQNGHPFTETQIRNWFAQMATAVQILKDKFNIIHGNIKPSNVLLLEDRRRIKLGDFGISKLIDDPLATSFQYMSPQALFGEKSRFEDDVWSLGVVLFELATLQRPFTQPTRGEVYMEILQGKWSCEVTGSAPLKALVGAMLKMDLDKRIPIGEVVFHEFLRGAIVPFNPEKKQATPSGIEEEKKQQKPSESSSGDEDLSAENDFLKAENKELQEKVGECEAKTNVLEREIARLKQNEEQMQAQLRALEANMAETQRVADDLSRHLAEKIAQIKKLKEENPKGADALKLQEELNDLRAKYQAQAEQLRQAQELVADLDSKLQQQNQANSTEMAALLEQAQAKNAQLDAQLKDSQGRYQMLEQLQAQLKKQLNDALLKIDQLNNQLIVLHTVAVRALLEACYLGDGVMARSLLVSKIVDVNEKYEQAKHGTICGKMWPNGVTCLMLAALRERVELVKMLLNDFRANVNVQTGYGSTALHYAVLVRNFEIVQLLCELGTADVDVKDSAGWNALMIASSHDNYESVAFLHLPPYTPARAKNKGKLVNYLLSHGAKVNDKNKRGKTALRLAVGKDIQDLLRSSNGTL